MGSRADSMPDVGNSVTDSIWLDEINEQGVSNL
jgi:hypothetical protein